MSTRFRLGKGFTYGRSGLRYGRSIPGVDKSYVSVGRSGTLLSGFGVRHWSPGRQRAVAVSSDTPTSDRGVVVLGIIFIALIWGMFAFIGAAERDYCADAPSYAAERTPVCAGTP